MSGVEQKSIQKLHPGWDLLIVTLLGTALLAAGWLDVSAYLRHRGQTRPTFAFLDEPVGERLGATEIYHLEESLVVLENIGQLEGERTARFRHGLGPRSVISIWTEHKQALLNFVFYNPIVGQDITVTCNGQAVEAFASQPECVISRKFPLNLQPGHNEIDVVFARYNHAGVELTSTDDRAMAGMFTKLELVLN